MGRPSAYTEVEPFQPPHNNKTNSNTIIDNSNTTIIDTDTDIDKTNQTQQETKTTTATTNKAGHIQITIHLRSDTQSPYLDASSINDDCSSLSDSLSSSSSPASISIPGQSLQHQHQHQHQHPQHPHALTRTDTASSLADTAHGSLGETQLAILFPFATFLHEQDALHAHSGKVALLSIFVVVLINFPAFLTLYLPLPPLHASWDISQILLVAPFLCLAYQYSIFFDGVLLSYFSRPVYFAYLEIETLSMSPPVTLLDATVNSCFALTTTFGVLIVSFLTYSAGTVLVGAIPIACNVFPLPFLGPLALVLPFLPCKGFIAYLHMRRTISQSLARSCSSIHTTHMLRFLHDCFFAAASFAAVAMLFFLLSEAMILLIYRTRPSPLPMAAILLAYQLVLVLFKLLSRAMARKNSRQLHIVGRRAAELSAVWGSWCDYGCQLFIMMAIPSVSSGAAVAIYLVQQSLTILAQPLIDTNTGRNALIRFFTYIFPESIHHTIKDVLEIVTPDQREASLQISCSNFFARMLACVTFVILASTCYFGPNKQYMIPFNDMSYKEYVQNMKLASASFLVALLEMIIVRAVLLSKYKKDIIYLFARLIANNCILIYSTYTSALVFSQLAVIAHSNLLMLH